MIEPAYHFCPQCGKPLSVARHGDDEYLMCENGHHTYKNQNVCVSGVLVKDGALLLVRRAFEPQKGMYDLFGGFVEPNERPGEAMVREAQEELGIEVRVIRLLGAYGPDEYPYKGIVHYNIGLTYLLELVGGSPQAADDVASFEWVKLDHLPYGQMAFASQNEFLDEFKKGNVSLEK